MAGPYRDTGPERRAEAPSDQGIVGDVIAQFADQYAFLRELVQNAIDAGTPSIDVKIAWDGALGRIRVSVRDKGAGMTRDVIENQLLVLFRSTKENDRTKIGKFGIGFASVLAPNPTVVIVETVSAAPPAGERRRLALQLSRDLTYRLFDAGPATQVGTVVELELPMEASAVDEFIRQCLAALERWCRHAAVPIQAEATGPDGRTRRARIDRPLGLAGALVEVRAELDDGQLVIVLGLMEGAQTSLGFFNHGLMLWETTEPLIGRYACKIQDARLGHTLSRDNVRRDEAYHRALRGARELVAQLLRATEAALEAHASAENLGPYTKLDRAVRDAAVGLAPARWHVPLIDPVTIDGAPVRAVPAASTHPSWFARKASPLTACLARHGVKLARPGCGPAPVREHDVHELLVLVSPVATPTPYQQTLVDVLETCFSAAGRSPRAVELAQVASDTYLPVLAIAAEPDDAVHAASTLFEPYVVPLARAQRSPFARLRKAPLVLNVDHPAVRGTGEPRIAGSQLARLILLQHELLDVERSEKLLAHTLLLLGVP